MTKIKPTLPKGFRDFGPTVFKQRKWIMDSIAQVFKLHAFEQIETPALEDIKTLTGKYGEEGDQLLFRVLDSGDFMANVNSKNADLSSTSLRKEISSKGLHYDLTIPLARYVAANQHEVSFPFKRFQIQAVWRADKPQKGRYREFVQCDADILGSESLWCEYELVNIYLQAFEQLGLTDITIKLNNRKLLQGIVEDLGFGDRFGQFTVILDKYDKIGHEGVKKLLTKEGFAENAIEPLLELLTIDDLTRITAKLGNNVSIQKGLAELNWVYEKLTDSQKEKVKIDLTLARGLDYYTGFIFEVVHNEVQIGSIGGGGRYDNLTEMFGLTSTSGVGISFGIDRIYDVLDETNGFALKSGQNPKILVLNLGADCLLKTLNVQKELRENGIAVLAYPDEAKMKKQMKFADKTGVTHCLILGEEELVNSTLVIKDMRNRTQEVFELSQLEEITRHLNM